MEQAAFPHHARASSWSTVERCLTFMLGHRLYGVDMRDVVAILYPGAMTPSIFPTPAVPGHVRFGNHHVPVMDAGVALGLSLSGHSDAARIILLHDDDGPCAPLAALLVQRVIDVRRLGDGETQSGPSGDPVPQLRFLVSTLRPFNSQPMRLCA